MFIYTLTQYTNDLVFRFSFKQFCEPCPDPLDCVFQPDANFGAVNERIERLLEDFQPFKRKRAKKEFRNLMKLKVMQSMCPPGEPVGLLAAQVCMKIICLKVVIKFCC